MENYVGRKGHVNSAPAAGEDGKDRKEEQEIYSRFFGQSSFSRYSIVDKASVVNAKDLVRNEEEGLAVRGDGRAIYFADEIPLLKTKTQEQIQDIHQAKLAFPGSRIVQDPQAETNGNCVESPLACFTCKGEAWWVNNQGGRICALCHPPADKSLVAEWIPPPKRA